MSKDALFLDTNGWFALLSERDVLHDVARARWVDLSNARRPVVLTDWIIAETGNGLARTSARRAFASAVRDLRRNRRVQIFAVSRALLDRALELYDERPDKAWGLVDCASILVMQDEGITDAFTTDAHFEQAGFRCLLPT